MAQIHSLVPGQISVNPHQQLCCIKPHQHSSWKGNVGPGLSMKIKKLVFFIEPLQQKLKLYWEQLQKAGFLP